MTDPLPPLPDELIEGVRQRLETAENYQWELGDYLLEAVDEMAPHLAGHVQYPMAYMIRHISARVGCDASTLRDRVVMARFYPAPVRQEYAPLTYYQLRACKAAGDRWREYADWALANLPAPVAAIRAKVKHNGDLPPAWLARWERFVSTAEQLASDADTPPAVRNIASGVVRAVSKVRL